MSEEENTGQETTSSKKEKKNRSYRLVFRYRHKRQAITFYDPPEGLCESNKNWNYMIEAMHEALHKAFGEVINHVIGVALYLQGPVIPLSVVIKKPKKYSKNNGVLDLILDDESPFLADLQVPQNMAIKSQDKLKGALTSIDMVECYDMFQKEEVDYDAFLLLEESDLKNLQLTLGQRKKMMKLIATLKDQKKNRPSKWSWEDSQQRLSLPKHIPLSRVEPIPFTRLLDVKYSHSYDHFLAQYLRYYGYAFVKLPDDMVQKLNKFKTIWNEFFDKEEKEKEICTLDRSMSDDAFGGYYDEKDRQMFHIAPMMLGCTPPWPPNDPEFQQNAVELFRLLETCAKTCLTAVARSMNIDPNLFLNVCENEFFPRLLGSSCRVCKYKKQEENEGIICTEHTDTTILSIGPVSSVPELQFYDRNRGEWIYVEDQADETHFIVFVGRILSRMTCGYFQPAFHRVFRKSGDERLSMPFFLRPKDDATFEIEKIVSTSNIRGWTRPEWIAPQETLRQDPAIFDQY